MPVLVSALLLHATLCSALPCPPDVCLESALKSAREPEAKVYGRELRAMMRSFEQVRGRQPTFITTEGTSLSPSMSVRSIERRLRADGSNPGFRVLYGRCASHDEDCPSADVEVRVQYGLDALDVLDCEAKTARRVIRAGDHVVVEHVPQGNLQEFEVSVGSDGCAGDRDADTDDGTTGDARSAWIFVSGTHGMAHAVLGRLPVRAIMRALAG